MKLASFDKGRQTLLTWNVKAFPRSSAVRKVTCASPSEPSPDFQSQAPVGGVMGYFVAPKLNVSLTLANTDVSL